MKKILVISVLICTCFNSFGQQFNPDSSQVYFINNIANSSSGVTAFDDGNNGSYVLWMDSRSNTSSQKTAVYFQHLNKYGVPKYAQNGKMLFSITSAASYILGYKAIKTQNGFVVSWTTQTDSLFCNYFSFSGNALWTQPTLVAKKTTSIIYITNIGLNIMPTDSGYFISYALTYTGGSDGCAYNRVDFNGNLRWPFNYFQISTSAYLITTSDKHNGFYYAAFGGGLGSHIFVQHFNLQGVKSYANNIDISTLAGGRGNSSGRIVCDNDTNAYVIWESSVGNKIVISKITPHKGLAWLPDYRTICGFTGTQTEPNILYSDNSIYTIWNDGRPPASNYFIYAQRTDTAGNMLWRQDGDSLCRLASYIPAPALTKNASGDLVASFLTSNFLAQRTDTLANHKWKENGRAISFASNDKPFYGDYSLVSNPDSSTTIFWLSFTTKKVCAAKINYYGNLENAAPLPNRASPITGNDSICAGSTNVVYTSSAIPNATKYLWQLPNGVSSASGSDTTLTPSIALNFSNALNGATISLSGLNSLGAGASSADFDIHLRSIPAAAGVISGLDSAAACTNQLGFTYGIAPLANASSYYWTLPPLATLIGNPDSNVVRVDYSPYSSSGTITVSGVNVCGPGLSASLPVHYKAIPTAKICFSTVDSASQKVKLFWQQPQESYARNYIVYRENAGVFVPIDTLAHQSFNGYLDTSSQPNLHPEKYKIAVLDSCGNAGDISAVSQNNSIYLYGLLGWATIPKLYWTDYVGADYDSTRYYRVLVDVTGNGIFTVIADSLPRTTLNFTDYLSPLPCTNCRYLIETFYRTICDPYSRAMIAVSTSRSNIKNKSDLYVDSLMIGRDEDTLQDEGYSIYPNPAKEKINIGKLQPNARYQISMYNSMGKSLLHFNTSETVKCEIPTEGFSKGLYLLTINTGKRNTSYKIQLR